MAIYIRAAAARRKRTRGCRPQLREDDDGCARYQGSLGLEPDLRAVSEHVRHGEDAPAVIEFATKVYLPVRDSGTPLMDSANHGYGRFANDIVKRHIKLVNLKGP